MSPLDLDKPQTALLLQHEIEQFYYHEAELLEAGDYETWLEIFTKDIRYWMPVRETHVDRALGVRGEGELAIYDDDFDFLSARVQRFKSTLAHAERPPSRLRYFVSNVRIRPEEDQLKATCSLLVNQTRLQRLEHQYVGERFDRLRRTADGLRVSHRRVVLDHTTLPRSLTVFF